MRARLTSLLVLLALPLAPLSPEATPPPYEPYRPEEFPTWAHTIRRFEIISLGIFPFALLFTNLGYSLYRYATHDWDPRYAPAPFTQPGGEPLSDEEHLRIYLIAGGISLAAAFIDALIVARRRSSRPAAPAPTPAPQASHPLLPLRPAPLHAAPSPFATYPASGEAHD